MRLKSAYELFKARFPNFTEIQILAFPHIEKNENCMIMAPTGSGKTEAAILPLLEELSKKKDRQGICVLYITPLRALNRDLLGRLTSLCSELGITIEVRHGDTKQKERARQTANPPQFLITTPETLQTILLSPNLRTALKNLNAVVVDELHELYHNKRGAQLSVGLERVAEIAGEFQRIGVSATIWDGEEVSRFLCGERKCTIIESRKEKVFSFSVRMPTKPAARHEGLERTFGLNSDAIARIEEIERLVKESGSSIIFANTRQVVESLGSKLMYLDRTEGFGPIAVHHSSLDKEERIAVENAFKKGEVKAVVATSSLELGIDVGMVDLVIQYNSPRQATRLIQRVGRGGHREDETSNGAIIVGSVLDALEAVAICELAVSKRLERYEAEYKAYDVALNQVCAMILEKRSVSKMRAFSIIARSWAYKDLTEEEFGRIIMQGQELRMLREKDGMLGMGSRTMAYFFGNISLIADRTHFAVRSSVNNRIIGNLDEHFVANYIDEGTVFITKGLAWKVISIEDYDIYVEPTLEVEAAVPDWEGEDIPVSNDVASKVFEFLEAGRLPAMRGISVDRNVEKELAAFLERQKGFPIREDMLVAEVLENYVIVYAPMGTKANELLGKMLSHAVRAQTGGAARTRATPYAIIIEMDSYRMPEMKKVFGALLNMDIDAFIGSRFVRNTEIYRYRFVQIAKAFGILDKKAAVTRSAADRLIEFYNGTPVEDEVKRDLAKNYFDADSVKRMLDGMRNGWAECAVFHGHSAFSEEILKAAYKYSELMLPLREDSAEVKDFVENMNRKKVVLFCTFCGFRSEGRIDELAEEDKISCKVCGSPMVSVWKEGYESAFNRMKSKKKLSKEDREEYGNMMRSASLVEAYGPRAVAALSTYGIGIETAARELKLLRKDFDSFIVDLIKAQKAFIRNRRFWS